MSLPGAMKSISALEFEKQSTAPGTTGPVPQV